ncbi:hypothetical protein G5B37_08570 [Rasiella rasia]|uniref:Bulb-type lectin domain-containing protein n=1 Tax=Rasiella rasia TaxID=2744027 RepID=A0A6G6GM64_9FLAO|nr:hypothetical protein [Rasiella rasia]QIE59614.1 hypothetical protein G5B37_08570 [Rasiella rasia]
MDIKYWFILSACLLGLVSCSSDDGTTEEEEMEQEMMENSSPIEGTVSFARNLGGSDDDFIVSIVEVSDGSYVMAGSTESTDGDITDKTSDDKDVWVVKTSATGAVLWSKTFGGSNQDEATSISKTADGGFIVSAFTFSDDGDVTDNAGFIDFWVLKLSSSGDLEWENTYGFEGSDTAHKIKQLSDGGYLVLGVLDITASGGAGNIGRNTNHAGGDYWVLRLNPIGEIIWARFYGGTFTDTAYDFVEVGNGDFIIVGSSDSDDVDITNNKGEYDFWMLNITGSGDINWKKNFGGSEIDLGYSLAKTTDGNFIATGDTRSSDIDVNDPLGNADVWAVKFNAAGTIIWEHTYGGSQFDSARSITPMSNGYYTIAASSRSNDNNLTSNYGVNDAWFIVIDEEGTLVFEKSLGGSKLDFGIALLETSNTEIVMVGNTESSDGDFTQNKGGKDAFLIKVK